jgi:hypothetical protein
MKYFFIIFLISLFISFSAEAKWTVLDSNNSVLNQDNGWTDGIVFDDFGGYFFQGAHGRDQKYKIYHSVDRGFTWTNVVYRALTWGEIKGQKYIDFMYDTFIDKCLTKDFLYVVFNTADEKINLRSGPYAFHKINDSTLTKNAVILKLDRTSNEYEMIDTKILDRITGIQMLDDNYGIVVGLRSVYRTEDGCRTFNKIFTTDTNQKWYFFHSSIPTKNDYYIISKTDQQFSKIYYTNDAGVTWNLKKIPDSTYYVESIAAKKVFLLNILKYRTRLLYTEDNFESYTSVLDTAVRDQGAKGNIHIKDSLYYISYLFQANAFISFNKGKSWISEDSIRYITSPPETFLKDGAIVDDKTIAILTLRDGQLYIYEKNKPVSVRELPNSKNTISIYPNPLPRSTPLNINLKDVGINSDLQLKIIDINGKLIDEFLANSTTADMNLQYLPDTNLTSGTYFFVIESNGEVIAKEKLVVE